VQQAAKENKKKLKIRRQSSKKRLPIFNDKINVNAMKSVSQY